MAEHDHQCQNGCGNIAELVIVTLTTSDTDIVCMPCFLRLANDIAGAFVENAAKAEEEYQASIDNGSKIVAIVDEHGQDTGETVLVQDGTSLDLDTTPVRSDPTLPEAFR